MTKPSLARLHTTATWLLYQSTLRTDQKSLRVISTAGSRRYHYSVLAALDEFGPASQADLCRRCDIDRSDMNALVNGLAKQRWVERTPDPGDKRRNIVTITPAGRRQLHRLDRILSELDEEMFAPLSASEKHQLIDMLGRILEHNA
ncbi:MarR family winged helix-turn-helix transcriptional regulator [Nocardia sp. NPDC051570]|uniref:MarR family winged helix-turn-helix transcriptional regulator n=1 Tax=Nocardia sp. NPDC051570 TaxID=3364324 RepID=UPI00379BD7F2